MWDLHYCKLSDLHSIYIEKNFWKFKLNLQRENLHCVLIHFCFDRLQNFMGFRLVLHKFCLDGMHCITRFYQLFVSISFEDSMNLNVMVLKHGLSFIMFALNRRLASFQFSLMCFQETFNFGVICGIFYANFTLTSKLIIFHHVLFRISSL